VADFQKYAKVVATLDLDLCHSVSTLETVERNQLAIEKKMYEINSSLDQIEVFFSFFLSSALFKYYFF
jgi:hypothetical protein